MPQDDLDHIPAIIPTRDGEPPRGTAQARPSKAGARRPSGQNAGAAGRGSGLLARLTMTIALVVAAVACAWAWQLQRELAQAGEAMDGYARRISDLEDRLSDTDEGMSQNAALQAAKIRELDSEVRKLWDNVWKATKERLAVLERDSAAHGKKIGAATASLDTVQAQIREADGDIARLKSVASDLERLMASARTNQAEVERVADTLNRINLDLAKLNKRVQGNEEWISSINTFRKQVNASLVELQAAVRSQPGVQ